MTARLLPRTAVALVCLALLAACHQTSFTRRRDVGRLKGIFPALEKLRVEAFRDQDWCRNIAYRQGKFSTNNRQSTCNLFEGEAAEMNAEANRDFAAVERSLADTGVSVLFMNAEYDTVGRIVRAEFDLDCFFCSRPRYVYEPNYGKPPSDMAHEMWFTAIDGDWYLVEEDWN